jgi:hypothetical protein
MAHFLHVSLVLRLITAARDRGGESYPCYIPRIGAAPSLVSLWGRSKATRRSLLLRGFVPYSSLPLRSVAAGSILFAYPKLASSLAWCSNGGASKRLWAHRYSCSRGTVPYSSLPVPPGTWRRVASSGSVTRLALLPACCAYGGGPRRLRAYSHNGGLVPYSSPPPGTVAAGPTFCVVTVRVTRVVRVITQPIWARVRRFCPLLLGRAGRRGY